MELKNILCPTDFSESSSHAIDHARAIAAWYKAGITALHVVSPVVLAVPAQMPVSPGEMGEIDHLRRRAAGEFAAASAAGVPLSVFVDVGDPVGCILDRAGWLPADLIVMGTHGAGGFERLVLGSVTEKVLRKAACPVLTVPPRAKTAARVPYERVLCAVDFSDSSLAAAGYAVSLAQESNAALTLLYVTEWPWPEPPSPSAAELPATQAAALDEYRRYCGERASARLRSLVPASGAAARAATAVENGKPYVRILQRAAEEHADLIVVGVRGRNPLDMSLFGSTTNQIVRQATCPVLTVPS